MSGHTPTPWEYRATAGDHDFAVYDEATGHDIALVRDFNEANAELIVRAVNSHADLLAEMKHTAESLRRYDRLYKNNLPLRRAVLGMIVDLEAAIAKAEEES